MVSIYHHALCSSRGLLAHREQSRQGRTAMVEDAQRASSVRDMSFGSLLQENIVSVFQPSRES